MKQNYFVYNGKKYYSGTILHVLKISDISYKMYRTNAEFLWYDTETKEYNIKIYDKEYTYNEKRFYNAFVGIYEHTEDVVKTYHKDKRKLTFFEELNIDCLFIAWMWYIFIMVTAIIFYDRIYIWIFASIIFFNYRNKKLKEAGYK